MKKLAIIAVAVITAFGFASCDKKGSKSSLKNDLDSLSYAIGMQRSGGLDMYLAQLGVDSAYYNDFYRGLKKSFKEAQNKKDVAYNVGVMVGTQIGDQMLKNVNNQIFAGDSTQGLNRKQFLAGFLAAAKKETTAISDDEAFAYAQTKGDEMHRKAIEKMYAPNREKGEKFVEEYAKQEGVTKLESGVLYKVIETGTGATFADSVQVLVNYEGKLIDETVFDSSYKRNRPQPMIARNTIPGFQEILTMMPAGSKWEVVIPQELAYGAKEMGNIKPYSTLIFTIELVGKNDK